MYSPISLINLSTVGFMASGKDVSTGAVSKLRTPSKPMSLRDLDKGWPVGGACIPTSSNAEKSTSNAGKFPVIRSAFPFFLKLNYAISPRAKSRTESVAFILTPAM